MKKENNEAVFLDRDGTINEEVGYLDRMDKLRLIAGAAEAVGLINRAGMKAVVITNQAGVARGFFEEDFVREVHSRIQEELGRSGARIDRYYYCPHHPTEGRSPYLKVCDCRKPGAGLFLAASRELDIELGNSYMIGDTAKDIEAARSVGVKGILVKTGYGMDHLAQPIAPAYIADDILEAVRWIMRARGA